MDGKETNRFRRVVECDRDDRDVRATGDEVKITPNPESEEAETTLALSPENLVKLINGDLNPMVAFTLGKLKVFGSKGIALKLSGLLNK